MYVFLEIFPSLAKILLVLNWPPLAERPLRPGTSGCLLGCLSQRDPGDDDDDDDNDDNHDDDRAQNLTIPSMIITFR